jgi:hypothetical protein
MGVAPLPFNFVVDVFFRMLIKSSSNGLIKGLCPKLFPRGVFSLENVDDTLLFLDNSNTIAINLKWILTCFEQISQVKINYHKSELISINMEEEECSLL